MLEHYRCMHEAQIKRNEQFVNERRLLFSVAVILATVLFYVAQHLELILDFRALAFYFNLLFAFGVFAYINILDKLIKASLVKGLRDISPAKEWKEYEVFINNKFRNNRSIDAGKVFEKSLAEAYVEAATVNQSENDKIGKNLNKAMYSIFICSMLSMPALLDIAFLPLHEEQKKEIVCDSLMPKNQEQSQDQHQSKTPQVEEDQ
ncbi:hypothetical protein L4C39_20020 [Vibrio clamense]|uniref:hypothetical protein n=1 Tax=Vibrio clamense TaxID=2910254 RepID=UPI003D212920